MRLSAGTIRPGRIVAWCVLAAVAMSLVWCASALGHAQLVVTVPGQGTVIERSPERVQVQFNEAVALPSGGIRIVAPDGSDVEGLVVERTDSKTVSARLPAPLPVGTHTVTWRVVSADTHPISGAFTFSVGHETETSAPALAVDATPPAPRWAVASVRAVDLALIVILVGGAWALLACLGRAVNRLGRWPLRCAAVAAGLLAANAALSLLLQSANVAGSFNEGLGADALESVLRSQFGSPWLARIAICAAICAIAIIRARDLRRRLMWIAVIATPLVVLPALAGHSRADGPLVVVVDTTHVAAAALWGGGLLALLVVVLRSSGPWRAAFARRAVPRLSRLALWCVVAVGAAGVILAWRRLDHLSDLIDTTYGRLVLAKIVVFTALLVMGTANRWRTVPQLQGPRDRAAGAAARFTGLARGEVIAIAAILALTGALITTAPPTGAALPTSQPRVIPRPVDITTDLGPYTSRVVITPAVVGENRIDIYTRDAAGVLVSPDEVRLSAALPSHDIDRIDIAVSAREDGHHVATRARLPLPGAWALSATARFGEFESHTATVTVAIAKER